MTLCWMSIRYWKNMQDNPLLEFVGETFSQFYCQQGHSGNLSKRMTWQMNGIWKFMLFTSTSPIQHYMLCTFACILYIYPHYRSKYHICVKVSVTQCQINCIMLKQWGKRWILHTYIHTYTYTHTHTHTHTYIHTYINTHTYIHIYIHT